MDQFMKDRDDAERLDWLEAHCSVSFRWKEGWVQGPIHLRDAIDVAMRSYPAKPESKPD